MPKDKKDPLPPRRESAHGAAVEDPCHGSASWRDRGDNYCQRLADTPVLGRACDHIRPGLLRAEHAGHVVFFRPT